MKLSIFAKAIFSLTSWSFSLVVLWHRTSKKSKDKREKRWVRGFTIFYWRSVRLRSGQVYDLDCRTAALGAMTFLVIFLFCYRLLNRLSPLRSLRSLRSKWQWGWLGRNDDGDWIGDQAKVRRVFMPWWIFSLLVARERFKHIKFKPLKGLCYYWQVESNGIDRYSSSIIVPPAIVFNSYFVVLRGCFGLTGGNISAIITRFRFVVWSFVAWKTESYHLFIEFLNMYGLNGRAL